MGKPTNADKVATSGRVSRAFANWVVSQDGWLKGYPQRNVVAFDFYDVLSDHGEANFLRYPTEGGIDNHPSSEGNRKATAALVPFLNRAVQRAFAAAIAVAEPAHGGAADSPRGVADSTQGAADSPRGAADSPRGAADSPRGVADSPRGAADSTK